MYTYNITFVMGPQEEETFIIWLHQAASAKDSELKDAENLRLQKVIRIGGEKPDADHGLSIALQADFTSELAAEKWGEIVIPKLTGAFMAKFGPNAAFFTTLLETTAFYE
ncbi:MAG: DUF4286 family protein [Bacteroides sp.]|nr:DUF4286 family protein [Bacteroides sp.]